MKNCKIALCVLSVMGMVGALTSCAIFTDSSSTSNAAFQIEGTQHDELIAIDLVNALLQFKGMHPADTRLKMTRTNTGFSTALHAVLGVAGYTMHGQAQLRSQMLTSHVERGRKELTGHHRTYMLSVGTIKIKRDYFLQDWGVTPSSNLYVQGADASQIILNDDLFFDQAPTQSVAARAPTRQLQASPAAPTSLSSRNMLVDQARIDRQNMYDIGGSNFGQIFDEFYDVSKISVVFSNDSMRLGRSGKTSINQFLSTYNRDTDVVSVVGCSHGRTSIQDGNKRLAIGRADRVAEALLYAGVPENKVLEEGCWASKPFDEVFPRRGVVLTLKREKRNG